MFTCRIANICIMLTMAAAAARPVLGLDGNNPLNLSTHGGWGAFELVTQQDSIATLADPIYGNVAARGLYDGIGIYRNRSALEITVNHELGSQAAISRLEVGRDSLRQAVRHTHDGSVAFPTQIVSGIGFAYDMIFDAGYHALTNPSPVASGASAVLAYGDANFARFCSATSYAANGFGSGFGFGDSMLITGEEVAGGKMYALDLPGRALWEIPDFGLGYWENAALVDSGNDTHVAVLLSSDLGSAPGDYLRLYVGRKQIDANGDGTVDFLERNGLRGGAIYYFAPEAGASLLDLPDGTVTGSWSPDPAVGLRDTKLEDVHTNPLDGSQVVLGAQLDGVYRLQLQLSIDDTGLDVNQSTTVIQQLRDDDIPPIGAPDNVNWSADGTIYVQEDGDGNGIFRMDATGANVVEIATAFSEPSGIVDISSQAGYLPGSVLLSSIMGSGNTGAQLVVLVSPQAMLDPARDGDFDDDGSYTCADIDALVSEIVAGTHNPAFDVTLDGWADTRDVDAWLVDAGAAELASGHPFLPGDANLDGVVDGQDFVVWNSNKFTLRAAWCAGDFNADGVVDGQDFVIWNTHKFQTAATAVPESAHALVMCVACLVPFWLGRRAVPRETCGHQS